MQNYNFMTAGQKTTTTGQQQQQQKAATTGGTQNAFKTNTTFGFGSFSQPAAPEPVSTPEIPPEIKNKSVKSLLDTMESQLESQSRSFQSQARQIARWDRMLYECMEMTQHLEEQIKKTEAAQKEMQQSATSLLQDQDQFIQNMKEKVSAPLPQSADQRQKLYRLAHHLGDKFLDMETQLKEIVNHIENQSQAESSSDIDKITQISNCHLNSMQWMINQCSGIDEKIEMLTKKLPESFL